MSMCIKRRKIPKEVMTLVALGWGIELHGRELGGRFFTLYAFVAFNMGAV